MIFKQLELSGFKSFAEKTTLVFEPGVTAIVGPNGSGKSNLSDAVRWVLGEQSARELRGGRMEDLIFNGTDARPPLNVAEVSLTFDNSARLLPTDYAEVTVTRRLYRSGESEYLLNKTTVRLKDILELLMGTGIGTSAYSLFEQGKIDQLIHARPEERRAIFEEAAGITKYKTQKREALRKLEQTEENLLRLNDVVSEVRRQLAAIERQVRKARAYREQWERLKEIELALAQREFHRLAGERQAHDTRMQAIRAEEQALQERLAQAEEVLTAQRAELERINQRYTHQQPRPLIREQRASAVEAAARLSQCRNEQMRAAAQWHAAQARVQRLELEVARVAQEQADAAAQLAAVERTLAAPDMRQAALVAQTIQPKPGAEPAVAAALAEWARAVAAEEWETAARCADTLRAQGEERPAFLVRHYRLASSAGEDALAQAIEQAQRQGAQQTTLAAAVQRLQEEQALLASEREEAAQQLAELTAQETEASQALAQLEQEAAQREAAMAEAQQQSEAAARDRERHVMAVARAITEQEAAWQAQMHELEAIRQRLHEQTLAVTQISYQQESVTNRLQQVYQLAFVAAEPPAEQDWNKLTQECETLRRKLEGIGPVSFASIEENRELEERLSFLTSQQQDLEKAKADLHEAITTINRTTRAQFKETFQKIQQEFQTTFKTLFGGGEARLVLVDEEDLLESGIEIIARPPGKTLQSISLLSGGEKALTSIALLFAVFRVKPSPFCLLDEIDAPLDEANIDRFTRALKAFLKDSQFIIITHNKKTIVMADVMYGVTMEEQGVSKLVSVKLQETPTPQPAPPAAGPAARSTATTGSPAPA